MAHSVMAVSSISNRPSVEVAFWPSNTDCWESRVVFRQVVLYIFDALCTRMSTWIKMNLRVNIYDFSKIFKDIRLNHVDNRLCQNLPANCGFPVRIIAQKNSLNAILWVLK